MSALDDELIAPWIVLGGFVLAAVLILMAGPFERRGRTRLSAVLRWSCGVVVTATAVYWFSQVPSARVFVVMILVFPIVIAALIWWRKHYRGVWMDRVAAKGRGGYFIDGTGRPSFGLLPGKGVAVVHDDPGATFTAAVELNHRGCRLLGVQYLVETNPNGSRPPRFTGSLAQVTEVGQTYHVVQLCTPEVPTVVIQHRHGRGAGLMEDSTLKSNVHGALHPDHPLEELDLDDGSEFARRFVVSTTDTAFARTLLTPPVRALLAADPWFRIRAITFHRGVLMAAERDDLTEESLFTSARQLTLLAATVPARCWHHAANTDAAQRFVAVLNAADPTEQAWHPVRGPAAARRAVNTRRRAANRIPLTARAFWWRITLVCLLILAGGFFGGQAIFGASDSARDVAAVAMLAVLIATAAAATAKVSFWPKPYAASPLADVGLDV